MNHLSCACVPSVVYIPHLTKIEVTQITCRHHSQKELPVNVRRNHKARVKTPDKQSGTGIFTVTDDMRQELAYLHKLEMYMKISISQLA